MTVEFWQKGVPIDHKRIDTKRTVKVEGIAFKQGGLTYFKVDRFNNLVLANEDIINIKE